MKDVTVFEHDRPLTAVDVRAQVNLIQEVLAGVMIEGTHYGKIPGTKQKSLFKAGAEKLAMTFRLAPTYVVEDLSGPDIRRYRVTCRLTHQASGTVIGDGTGSGSTDEEKYRWRKPTVPQEFDATPEDRRRKKWLKGYDGGAPFEAKQVRTEPADLDNTVLKMACKRAFVAAILNATAASDIFTQDIEDLPEDLRDAGNEEKTATVRKPRSKTPAAHGATPNSPTETPGSGEDQSTTGAESSKPENDQPLEPGALAALRAQMKRAGRTDVELAEKLGVTSETIKFGRFNEVMKWLRENPAT